jgi:hypothetical protein
MRKSEAFFNTCRMRSGYMGETPMPRVMGRV